MGYEAEQKDWRTELRARLNDVPQAALTGNRILA